MQVYQFYEQIVCTDSEVLQTYMYNYNFCSNESIEEALKEEFKEK